MSQDLSELWKVALAQLEVKLDSPAHFKTWFQNTVLTEITDKKAVIGVNNSYAVDWLRKHHHLMIKETISYVCGTELEPHYEIDKSLSATSGNKSNTEKTRQPKNETVFYTEEKQQVNLHQLKRSALNEQYRFENYVVGSSNKLAHAAATGVGQNPGSTYNPLFIYGDTGLGKTHLAQAIAIKLLENDPTAKILYISSEKFLNDMVNAIRSGKSAQFRQKYRTLDLLIIDDIQFINKWKETQTEFFHTFNVLYNNKKQIILVSDRPPEQIKNLEDRLLSRFQGGMIVDISKPDFEMRMAILERKLSGLGGELPDYTIELIANIITDNVRELEGALQKILLYNNMKEDNLSVDEIKHILGKDAKSKRQKIKVPQIIKLISKEFNVTIQDIKGPRRLKDVAFARQVCMFILREDFNYKLEDIARYLNRKDHTTVIHAVDKIQSKLLIDNGFQKQINLIRDSINKFAE